MTKYAIKKIGTNEVVGFADGEGEEPPVVDGADVEAMITPVTGFPVVPFEGAVLIVTEGVLGWRDDRTIEQARADKTAEMSFACAASIFAGFTSSALGAEYLYPAKMTDQTNLAGSVLDSLLPSPANWATPFWCADAAGVWAFRMHTATQIQQVGRDGKTAILASMSHNEALRAQVAAATTIADVNAVVWA